MTGFRQSLVSTAEDRAVSSAWLTLALVALVLVPVPAVAVAARIGLAAPSVESVPSLLRMLLAATPLFALPPFLLGGGLGSFFHLVTTAPERFEAIEAGRSAGLNPRSMVASALIVGSVFAACGLVLAETALRLG